MKTFTLFFFLLSCLGFSQNLINNADFENHSDCPSSLGQFFLAKGWNTANNATPDYFNDCSSSYDYGTEFNKKGGQVAHSGHAYMGIQINDLHQNMYYEYLETELKSPLEKDQLYCISMYVSRGKSDCAVNQFGVLLSQTVLRSPDPSRIELPYTSLSSLIPLTDTLSWTCIKTTYKAKGGEQFLTLGSFKKDNNFVRYHIKPKQDSTFFSAYYFIDDVSLVAIKESMNCECNH